MNNEIWKTVNLAMFSHYEVSSLGKLRLKSDGRIVKQTTSVRGYLRASITSISGKHYNYPIHRFVAVTFLEIPEDGIFKKNCLNTIDRIPYQVNHKSGIKTDNYYKNLEWCDSKFNIRHAWDNELRTGGASCLILNVRTKELTRVHTYVKIGEFIQAPPSIVHDIINQHRTTPYLGTYLFLEHTLNSVKTGLHAMDKEFICKNYLTNAVIVYKNIKETSHGTKVKTSSIRNRLSPEYYKRITNLTNGWVIVPVNMFTGTWPSYTKEEASLSNQLYEERQANGTSRTVIPVICKNYITGSVEHYPSMSKLCKAKNWNYSKNKHWLNVTNNLYDGCSVKPKFNNRDFIDFSPLEVEASVLIKKKCEAGYKRICISKTVVGKNYATNEIKVFRTITDAAEELNLDRKRLGLILRSPNEQQLYKNWWFLFTSESLPWPNKSKVLSIS